MTSLAIAEVLAQAGAIHAQVMVDRVRLEVQGVHDSDPLGNAVVGWETVYEGSGLVQDARRTPAVTARLGDVATTGAWVAKLPLQAPVDSAKTYRLTVVSSPDEANIGVWRVVGVSTGSLATARLLYLEKDT